MFRCRLFSSQEHSIPILNGSEMEKIRTWHLGFVIAMETTGFFMTRLPQKDLSICWSIISQAWLSHQQKINLHTEAGVHGGCTPCLMRDIRCKQRGNSLSGKHKTLKTNLSKSKFYSLDLKSLGFTISQFSIFLSTLLSSLFFCWGNRQSTYGPGAYKTAGTLNHHSVTSKLSFSLLRMLFRFLDVSD